VAAVGARYLANGYSWARDSRAETHDVDGVAIKGSPIELIEVELTVKKIARYKLIHSEHGRRLSEGVHVVTYFCTPAVARVVSREADKFVFRDQRDHLIVHPSLDDQGR
jgi:hypothetical protein